VNASPASQTNIACFGGSNGTATVQVSGGSAPYTYSWSPSGGSQATATGLSAGVYVVTIQDANGCETTESFDISSSIVPVVSGKPGSGRQDPAHILALRRAAEKTAAEFKMDTKGT
jgi:hypothetical protein